MYYTREHIEATITIRPARPEDAAALSRLAGRDSAEVPSGEILVALVGDEIRAAVPLSGRREIADPFHRTGELVRMLELRVAQLREPAGSLGRRVLAAISRPQGSGLSPRSARTRRALGEPAARRLN